MPAQLCTDEASGLPPPLVSLQTDGGMKAVAFEGCKLPGPVDDAFSHGRPLGATRAFGNDVASKTAAQTAAQCLPATTQNAPKP